MRILLALLLLGFVCSCSDSRAAYYRSHHLPTSRQLRFSAEHQQLPRQSPAVGEDRPVATGSGPKLPTQRAVGRTQVEPDQLHLYGY
jgi:hypothetical protein